jgi:hypothetical protein
MPHTIPHQELGLCACLLLGIAACGDTSETLDDLLSEIDVQDAECRAKAGIA